MNEFFSNLKKCILIGAGGITGNWYARLLLRNGIQVYAYDSNSRVQYPKDIAESNQFQFVGEKEIYSLIQSKNIDGITLSPGVPLSLDFFHSARKYKIPVFSEFQYGWFFFRRYDKKTIGVTGTDGKSTTVHFISSILNSLGVSAIAAGNFGIPLSQILMEWNIFQKYEVFVFEFSSYQLELFDGISVDTALYLNLAPDHLNRYSDIGEYGLTKWNLAMEMNRGAFIYSDTLKKYFSIWKKNPADGINVDVEKIDISSENLKSKYFFLDLDLHSKLSKIHFHLKEKEITYSLSKNRVKIAGRHNYLNLLFSLEAVYSILKESWLVISQKKLDKAIENLTPLQHRFEIFLKEKENIYINDSKATTTQAVQTALMNVEGNLFLFMGGKGKGEDYSVLIPILKEKKVWLFLYGEERSNMRQIFKKDNLQIVAEEETLDKVYRISVDFQKKEKLQKVTYLLSPGVTSWDQYKSFEERGSHFKDLVKNEKIL